jgi:hypothetical protein
MSMHNVVMGEQDKQFIPEVALVKRRDDWTASM